MPDKSVVGLLFIALVQYIRNKSEFINGKSAEEFLDIICTKFLL